jgi:hypothetical protein
VSSAEKSEVADGSITSTVKCGIPFFSLISRFFKRFPLLLCLLSLPFILSLLFVLICNLFHISYFTAAKTGKNQSVQVRSEKRLAEVWVSKPILNHFVMVVALIYTYTKSFLFSIWWLRVAGVVKKQICKLRKLSCCKQRCQRSKRNGSPFWWNPSSSDRRIESSNKKKKRNFRDQNKTDQTAESPDTNNNTTLQ